MNKVERWKLVRVLQPEVPDITPMEIQISQANGEHIIGSKKAELGDTLLESPFVSRKHCQLVFRNKHWYLRDFQSLNGTYLNGERVECERELRENDIIGLGVEKFQMNLAPPLAKYYIFTLVKYYRRVEPEPLTTSISKIIPLITLDEDEEDASSASSKSSEETVSSWNTRPVKSEGDSKVIRESGSSSGVNILNSAPLTSFDSPGPSGAAVPSLSAVPVKTEKPEKSPLKPEDQERIRNYILQKLLQERDKKLKRQEEAALKLKLESELNDPGTSGSAPKRSELTVESTTDMKTVKKATTTAAEGGESPVAQALRKDTRKLTEGQQVEVEIAKRTEQVSVKIKVEKKETVPDPEITTVVHKPTKEAAVDENRNKSTESRSSKSCNPKSESKRNMEISMESEKPHEEKSERILKNSNSMIPDPLNVEQAGSSSGNVSANPNPVDAQSEHAQSVEVTAKAKEVERKRRAEVISQFKSLCSPMELLLEPVVAFTPSGKVVFQKKCLQILNITSLKRIRKQMLSISSSSESATPRAGELPHQHQQPSKKDTFVVTSKPVKKRRVVYSSSEEDDHPVKKMRDQDKLKTASSTISKKEDQVPGSTSRPTSVSGTSVPGPSSRIHGAVATSSSASSLSRPQASVVVPSSVGAFSRPHISVAASSNDGIKRTISASLSSRPHSSTSPPESIPKKALDAPPLPQYSDSESHSDGDLDCMDLEGNGYSPDRNAGTSPEAVEMKLDAVRRREEQRQKQNKAVKLLDAPLPLGRKRHYENIDSPTRTQHSTSRTITTSSTATARISHATPVIDKREKLRQIEIERRKRIEESKEVRPVVVKAPVVARCTKKSRSDLLLESTLAPNPVEPPPRKLVPNSLVIPTSADTSPDAPEDLMPLDRIFNDMENNRLSQVIENPRRVPAPPKKTVTFSEPTGNQSFRRPAARLMHGHGSSTTLAQPTEYQIRLAASLGPAPVITASSKSDNQIRPMQRPVEVPRAPVPLPLPMPTPAVNTHSSSQSSTTPRFPEDAVFRDVFNWSTNWLDEQGGHAKSPPVTGARLVMTNLPAYKDYESYTSVFYPLMLLELWASVARDYSSQENSLQRSHYSRHYYDRSIGKSEYEIGVDYIEPAYNCPILNYQYQSNKREYNVTDMKNQQRAFWYCFHLTALAQKRGDFNRDKNFGTITVDVQAGASVERKTLFCFIFTDSEVYDEIGPGTIFHKALKKNNSHTFKFSVTIVTHINFDITDVLRDKPGVLKKISYIAPKLREFKSLSSLPESKLFKTILSPPLPERSDIFNPNEAVNPASLVKRVHEMLNPVQRGIVNHISRRIFNDGKTDLMLLHGPPGTGKTRTIVALLLQLTQAIVSKNNQKILVCTPSNTAVDEIIRRYDQESKKNGVVKIVRIGNSGSSSLNKYSLDEAAKDYCAGASHLESLEKALQNEDKKIQASKATIERLTAAAAAATYKTESALLSIEKAKLTSLMNNRKLYVDDIKKVVSPLQFHFWSKRGTSTILTSHLTTALSKPRSAVRTGMEKARNDAILNAHIVFSTLASCSGGIVQKLTNTKRDQVGMKFTCCIVDEATQATEPECLAPLLLGCEKMILVGDPNQLPATVLSSEAENRKYRQSLFTRIYNFYNDEENRDRSPVMMLTTQYRMHPEILAWPNEWFYQNKLKTCSTVLNVKRKTRLEPYLFLNVSSQEDQSNKGQINNTEEVRLIREILSVIQHQQNIDGRRYADMTIGIITPYNDQKKKIIIELQGLKEISPEFWSRIEVDTVDSYQGREKDIVLLSCVRTDEMGFLKTPERLNVSLTRAKMSLIILGNAPCLNNNLMWKSLMDNAAGRGVFKRIPEDYKSRGDEYLKQCIERAILLPSK